MLGATVLHIIREDFGFMQSSSKTQVAREYQVVLTQSGFKPEETVLRSGDSIVFTSEVDEPFWPASDLHPSHTLYAAFDPKTPIEKGSSWKFTFTEAGSWKYHDHLNPLRKGVVVVLGDSVLEESYDCATLTGTSKFQCFDILLEEKLSKEGMEAAFDYFVNIYKENPDVGGVCHGWAHRLGEVEYGLYAEGREVSLRAEATFCSYGYFHGFINAMVEATQSLETALQFCDSAAKREQDGLKNLHNNCVHGIGHSIATLMLEDEAYWGDFNKSAEHGFVECERLFKPGFDLDICYDGMFHELHLSVMQETYGMSSKAYMESGDLFYFCHGFAEEKRESCFYDFVNLWPSFYKDDEASAMRYVYPQLLEIGDDALRTMRTFVRGFIEGDIAHGNYQDSVEACTLTEGIFFEACLEGLASGFVEHGEPNNMHVAGFSFCEEYFTGDTKELCLHKMVGALYWSYDDEHLAIACRAVQTKEEPSACLQF